MTSGGRGGRILEVTNLNADGPGSFREAFEATGPRIIVIKVEGRLRAGVLNNLSANQGDFSIWGQLAPGYGLTVEADRFRARSAGNIVVRHLTAQRAQSGCTPNIDCFDPFVISQQPPGTSVYVDHLSARYGRDQIYIVDGRSDSVATTSAYVLIAEGDPSHNTGTIIGSSVAADDAGTHTFARNMTYNVSHRFPNMGGASGRFEVYNNLYVNWAARLSRINGPITVDWHSNHAVAGRSHNSSAPLNKVAYVQSQWAGETPSIYSAGNIVERFFEDPTADQSALWVWFKTESATVGGTPVVENTPIDDSLLVSERQLETTPPPNGVLPADALLEHITANVGHTRGVQPDGSPGFFRDSLDSDYIERTQGRDLASRYREPEEWTDAEFPGTALYSDRDGDHMPDWFEDQHAHLDPDDEGDMDEIQVDWAFPDYVIRNDAGYTNLEICAEFYADGFASMLD